MDVNPLPYNAYHVETLCTSPSSGNSPPPNHQSCAITPQAHAIPRRTSSRRKDVDGKDLGADREKTVPPKPWLWADADRAGVEASPEAVRMPPWATCEQITCRVHGERMLLAGVGRWEGHILR